MQPTLTGLIGVLIILLCTACESQAPQATEADPQPGFVGSAGWADCHQDEFRQWQGSHHQLAMQLADSESVIGDFSGRTLSYFETEAKFFKRDSAFFVRLQNSAGEDEEFRVTHTFGITPLQQYLVALPGGRLQALQFAWDSRPVKEGGQRWFHLYPDEYIGPGDPLHWTGRHFNWNYMCSECHSTNITLNYDIATDSFNTTFDEISVGCEACHGPGSLHIEQAGNESFDEARGLAVNLDDRSGSAWVMNTQSGIAERSPPGGKKQQAESCGRCHSRRSKIAPEYTYGNLLADTHMPALLEEGLYHADGRILEEVYVYGSFVQSKMYRAGVTCSDCHDPHSGLLRAGPDPNDTCAQCHLPSRFATADHSEVNTGDCVSCHMPSTIYMGVDGRRDHSFRIPGAGESDDHYGALISAGRQGGANRQLLEGIANDSFPGIARATMLTLLEANQDPDLWSGFSAQLKDQEPLIRIAALRSLQRQAPGLRMDLAPVLLSDPVLGVRMEAAVAIAEFRHMLPAELAQSFDQAAGEYRDSMLANTFMPQSTLGLAEFETKLGNMAAAASLYEHAMKTGSDFGMVQHAYGLHLVRSDQAERALEHLRLAHQLEPQNARFTYVYGVALNSLGHSDQAIAVLADARRRFPQDYDIALALVTIYRDRGELGLARGVLREMQNQFPGIPQLEALAESLQTSQ